KYSITPSYSSGTSSLTGSSNFNYRIFPQRGIIRNITLYSGFSFCSITFESLADFLCFSGWSYPWIYPPQNRQPVFSSGISYPEQFYRRSHSLLFSGHAVFFSDFHGTPAALVDPSICCASGSQPVFYGQKKNGFTDRFVKNWRGQEAS
ncbi:MAG TPA: hypothetical protein PKK94_28670, partial [Leptospiraceae bacterium]|nr:hypothetical protein [Leptospiraceae bacterium]